MSQSIYPVPAHIKNAALVDNDKYNTLYKQSIDDPEGFWAEHGKRLDWSTPFTKVTLLIKAISVLNGMKMANLMLRITVLTAIWQLKQIKRH